MIFKLLLSLEKLSYGTPGVKKFEVDLRQPAAAETYQCFGLRNLFLKSNMVFFRNHLQDFLFGYKKAYALFFH
jgi:hypothetical protein